MADMDQLLHVHRQIANGLVAYSAGMEPTARTLSLGPGDALNTLQLIVGVGIGANDDEGDLAGEPGEPCLHLYTAEPMAVVQATAYAAAAFSVDALDAGVPVRTIHTGPVDLQAHRFRARPAPAGISVGHTKVSAGTFGALCRGRTGDRRERTLLLSNNHVLANVNAAEAGDPILQPGAYDGGSTATDVIGLLERLVPISFTAPNLVDAATAMVDPALVRPETVYISGGATQYFRTGTTPVAAAPGNTVGKSGRTTQLTAGRVRATGVTVNVNMGGGRIATFVNQISIVGTRGNFSAGGDSGSLIWTWDQRRAPVGLLFAGGQNVTFANPIIDVLNALDVDLI